MATTLPLQQQRLFDKLARDFDAREYAKGLRTADSILSVVPNHADTLALKGLTLHHMGRKEEGREIIESALGFNDTSTVVWHSLGMCHRADDNHVEALHAFQKAHEYGPSNVNVLRDISSICVQLREWEQFVDVRRKMVTLRPGVRANWIALSCGHRMLGNKELAAAVIDVMTTIMEAGDNRAEKSEVRLYQVELELACNAPARALDLLKKHSQEIIDEYEKASLRAKTHALLGQKVEAEKWYMELITRGMAEADCVAAIAQLRKIPLDAARRPKRDVDKYLELLKQVQEVNPKSNYAKRQVLECVPIEQFRDQLREYAGMFIVKTIPSLFSVLKSLYQCPDRTQHIGEVFHQWEEELMAGDFSSFGGKKDPTFILWVWMYLASHYCRIREFGRALEYIGRAIDHTPTFDLLYLMKAKIQAKNNQLDEAAKTADMARRLDLQDKYLNGKAAKYFFRANKIREGEALMQMFYKTTEVPDDTYLTALESQCAWYEREVGDAYYRMGDYISALSNYLMCESHHQRNHNELSEFHNYVFRRCTMRAWFNVIACDDNLEENKFFQKLCPRIVRTYMKIHEEGEEAVRAKYAPRPEVGKYSDVEEGKRIGNLRRTFYLHNVDISDPLKKAGRYLQASLLHNALSSEVHLLAVEFYTMCRMPFLVARELLILAKLKCPSTNELVTQFENNLFREMASSMDPRVESIIKETLTTALEKLN
ncbi:N-acetyltransferase subunit Nat1, putative [Trypanosoma brucei gambiense DAL972]|uniref:N-acetyltransferase subunit Nat1, putative n=3 Tax=Trypanosoma brucei TaxID=5691 RepID=D0A2V9_TRYB9|nr:N-acetyltransferase subunit Nat1, putative [Trypanosoma brucei gambiense DAL972]RHW68844.1 N-acetyltransferase subunit Nat1 [Trypanosoma brucei equiperdum]CAB89124.1 putative N-acetyltransferase subunit NAT1 [Trypanosoma brucei]CBH15603.1 N-acetyltransferase subunit Nat1, putative [Trypanosoma brucei gambiense DAL972]|eukprot:XP_011777867.1 N-acetyltransferase subunit Nat1, putative [Trypanosoma brucei gambiense DAL972]